MERSKVSGVLLLVFLCICLFSVPVLSGEHPWDEQEGNGGDDTTDNDSLVIGNEPLEETDVDRTDGRSGGFLFSLSYSFTMWYLDYSLNEVQEERIIQRNKAREMHRGVYRSRSLMR